MGLGVTSTWESPEAMEVEGREDKKHGQRREIRACRTWKPHEKCSKAMSGASEG